MVINMGKKCLLLIAVLVTAMSGYLLFGNGVEETYTVWVLASFILYSAVRKQQIRFSVPIMLVSVYIPLVFFGGEVLWENKMFSSMQAVCIFFGGAVGSYFFLNYLQNVWSGKALCAGKNAGYSIFFYMVALLLGWLPSFLSDFPGIILSDSTWQWQMALGSSSVSNHHPVAHTFLIFLAQKITALFSGTVRPTAAVAVYSVLQMVLLSLILAYAIKSIDAELQNRWVTLGTLACFALYPLNGIFAINMTKDTLFSAFVLLLGVLVWKICRTGGTWLQRTQNKAVFSFTLILVFLFRSNGFLVSFGTLALVFLFYYKKYWKDILICGVAFLVFWTAWGKALDIAGVLRPNISESLGMPLNQIGNIVSKDRPLTQQEEQLIEQVIPLDTLKEAYSPQYSDSIKWNEEYDSTPILQNKGEYLALWRSLLTKYPGDCLEASLNLTIGFWYPGVTKGAVSINLPQKVSLLTDIGAQSCPIISGSLMDPFIGTTIRENALFSWLFSIGNVLIFCWVLLAFTIQKGGWKYLCIWGPVLLAWLSLLLATPSYCETRYIYSAFLSAPLFLSVYCGCLKQKHEKENRHNG